MLKSLVILSLLFARSAYAQNQQPPSGMPPSQLSQKGETLSRLAATENSRNGLSTAPRVVVPSTASSTEAEQEKIQMQQEVADQHEVTVFTGLLVLVGFLQFVAIAVQAVFLWLAFRESKNASNAALRSAQAAEDSLTKLQRAFIGVSQIRYLSHLQSDGKVWWSVHMYWRNSGASPAKNVRTFISKYSETRDMPDDFGFVVPTDRPETFVGPNAEISAELPVSADELIEASNGKRFLYFWGRTDYRDIFDGTPEHATKILVRVTALRGDVTKVWDDKSNIVEIVMPQVGRHNSAD